MPPGAQLTCPPELASRGVGAPGSRAGRGCVTAAPGSLWLCWWLATLFTSLSLNHNNELAASVDFPGGSEVKVCFQRESKNAGLPGAEWAG